MAIAAVEANHSGFVALLEDLRQMGVDEDLLDNIEGANNMLFGAIIRTIQTMEVPAVEGE